MAKTDYQRHNIRYVLKNGKTANSVTQVIKNLGWNRDALIAYTRRETAAGNDTMEMMREAGKIGTLTHILIQGKIEGFDVDTRDFTPNQEEIALKLFFAFNQWMEKSDFKPLKTEMVLVNDEMRVGGTLDAIGKKGDDLVIVDWKTGASVYKDQLVQLGAYTMMYEAAQPRAKIDYGMIIRMDKKDFKSHQSIVSREKLDAGAQIFNHLVAINQIKPQL